MPAIVHYILPLFFCCFTGWFVIWITVRLLFSPKQPVFVAGVRLQGILPARQQSIAKKIGRLVSTQLFSFDALQQKATSPENFERLKPEIEKHIDVFLREKLKETFPMLSMLIGEKTINQMKTAFLTELETMFPALLKSYISNLEKELDIEKEVTEKIAGFSISEIENQVYGTAKKQLNNLYLLGAATGCVTGLLYLLLNFLLFS